MPHSQNGRAMIEILGASFGFATMSCIAHGFRGEIAWPVVAFARILMTMVLIYAALFYYRQPLLVRGAPALWWRSCMGTLGLLSLFYSVSRLPITDTVTIVATGPVWVQLILVLIFKKKLPRAVWGHALIALAGVYIMHRPRFEAESLPMLVALGGALAAAAAKVSLSKCHYLPRLSVVAHYATCATLASLSMCFLYGRGVFLHPAVAPGIWWWLIPMGLAGTLAQVLLTAAYAHGPTTLVALAGISQIAFAACYDTFIWRHPLDAWKLLGIAIIAIAIALSIRLNARQ